MVSCLYVSASSSKVLSILQISNCCLHITWIIDQSGSFHGFTHANNQESCIAQSIYMAPLLYGPLNGSLYLWQITIHGCHIQMVITCVVAFVAP